MSEDGITVLGISTYGGSIGPDGNHLRWSLANNLSFPPNGFRIYRRLALGLEAPLPHATDLSGLRENDTLETISIGPIEATYIGPAQLELRFPQTLARVQLTFEDSGSGTLRAFSGKGLLAAVGITAAGIIVPGGVLMCAGITRLILDLGSLRPATIRYSTQAGECDSDGWEEIERVSMLERNEWRSRLDGVSNYYLNGPNLNRDYEVTASQIVTWLNRMRAPLAPENRSFFQDPLLPAQELKVFNSDDRTNVAANLQSMFLVAAIDPNVARLMSLYWTDRLDFDKKSERDKLYDYKVMGIWAERNEQGSPTAVIRCGLFLNLGRPPSQLPILSGTLMGQQLPGLHWRNDEPQGRLGLTWPDTILQGAPGLTAVQPVSFELTRSSNLGEDVKLEPVLITANPQFPNSPNFVDTNLPIGTYSYTARPIDLFGQVGEGIGSNSIEIEDLEAPPPPVRLRAALSPDNSAVSVSFEFGGRLHQQAPDVDKFHLYWRPDSLIERTTVRVARLLAARVRGQFYQKVRITRAGEAIPLDELRDFEGDVLTNVVPGGQPLPASERLRYRIATIEDSGDVVLDLSTTRIAPGEYQLMRDPHNRLIWRKLSRTVNWRPPIRGKLKLSEDRFPFRVLSSQTVTPPPNPFLQIPEEMRGRQFPALTPEDFVEIEIDRLLCDPGAFVNGVVETVGSSDNIEIKSITAGRNGRTQLVLPADANIQANDEITLRPAPNFDGLVRWLRIDHLADRRTATPGGELCFYPNDPDEDGFESEVGARKAATTVRVISNAVFTGGVLDLLVRAENADDVTVLESNLDRTLRYYPPFELDGNIPLGPEAAGVADTDDPSMSLTLRASEGKRDGFIAISAVDVRGNAGPLSAPAQFTVVHPKPDAPPRPYPCGLEPNAEHGYASPPDRSGFATTCLTWDSGDPQVTEGWRYEVARALDSSILAVHLREWQKGTAGVTLIDPVVAGTTVKGSLSEVSFNEETGLIEAKMEPAGGIDAKIFRNGRLEKRVPRPAVPNETDLVKSFQVTLARNEDPKIGSKIELRLRGLATALPDLGDVWLTAPPDYSPVNGNYDALVALAEQVPDAFSMATGVPIAPVIETNQDGVQTRVNRFRDQIPGKGRNAFFYRIRAVDAAENRSEWSQISAPFHQVDTTPPEAPREMFSEVKGERVELRWGVPAAPEIVGYRVLRSRSVAAPASSGSANLVAELRRSSAPNELPLTLEPIRLRFGTVDLKVGLSIPAAISAGGKQPGVIAAHRLGPERQPLTSIDFLVRDPTQVSGRVVRHVNPTLEEGVEVVVAALRETVRPIQRQHASGVAITVVAGKATVDYAYGISQVIGVFRVDEFDLNAIPIETQTATNHFVAPATFDPTDRSISGLGSLTDGTSIVVLARCESPYVLGDAPDELTPLRVINREIDLAFPIDILEVQGVYRHGEFDRSAVPLTEQASRNYVTPSSLYVPANNQVTDLNADLNQGDPVVVVVKRRLPDGSEEFVALDHEPYTGMSLVAKDRTVRLGSDLEPIGVVGIYRKAEYQTGFALENQPAVNYHLPRRSEVDSASRSLVHLNQRLPEGAELVLDYIDARGNPRRVLERQDRYEFVDLPLDPSESSGSFFYCLIAIKEVRQAPTGPDIQIWSAPSPVCKAVVFRSAEAE